MWRGRAARGLARLFEGLRLGLLHAPVVLPDLLVALALDAAARSRPFTPEEDSALLSACGVRRRRHPAAFGRQRSVHRATVHTAAKLAPRRRQKAARQEHEGQDYMRDMDLPPSSDSESDDDEEQGEEEGLGEGRSAGV